jgi:hypothetical protein
VNGSDDDDFEDGFAGERLSGTFCDGGINDLKIEDVRHVWDDDFMMVGGNSSMLATMIS